MNSDDEDFQREPWRIRPRSSQEETERVLRLARESRVSIAIRKTVGAVIWAVTFIVMVVLMNGTEDLDDFQNAILVGFAGLVLGTAVFVPGRRDFRPEG